MRIRINKIQQHLMSKVDLSEPTSQQVGLRSTVIIRFCEHCGNEMYGLWHYLTYYGENSDYGKEIDSVGFDLCKEAELEQREFLKLEICPICGKALNKTEIRTPGHNDGFCSMQKYIGRILHKDNTNMPPAWIKMYNLQYSNGLSPWIFNLKTYANLSKEELKERESYLLDIISKDMEKERIPKDKNTAKTKIESLYIKFLEESTNATTSIIDTSKIKGSIDELQKYILSLIKIENNIYSLKNRLESLYYESFINCRKLSSKVYDSFKQQEASLKQQFIQSNKEYHSIENEIKVLKGKCLTVNVDYPVKPQQPTFKTIEDCFNDPDFPKEPSEPMLKKPSIFNKSKIVAENEALLKQYDIEVSKYKEEVSKYKTKLEKENELLEKKYQEDFLSFQNAFIKCADKEKKLLKDKENERNSSINSLKKRLSLVEEKINTLKLQENELNQNKEAILTGLMEVPYPEYAIQTILNNEILEAETLLKKLIEVRNDFYNLDIIFGKYRDIVALSTFYEYLMSGRCSELTGPNGAYNLYETECRSNVIISQLSKVIELLEEIKDTQYMICTELKSIKSTLERMNTTMTAAFKTIQNIECNTKNTNIYLNNISHNSAVIAHNTAVTAYYSKLTAEYTNSLGYLVALKN